MTTDLDELRKIYAGTRIEEVIDHLERVEQEQIEYLCEPCSTVHPRQETGKLLQPCPACGTAMTATSFNLREIQRLRVALELAEQDTRIVDWLEQRHYLHTLGRRHLSFKSWVVNLREACRAAMKAETEEG